eukprot:CAMPEP_0177750962 /NCGR_PEP_ID=MMETSP0491_2-20121128/120_1 /TAXON_ID=63592 /ORGANISM="Tetraselmis chuii, Strain PLY429" /LENGTH=107 /DNA_ID=CAMNT_0019266043 /DNA_START=96 /DNA_END=419 /DNA_ORIENTATION=-
MSSRILSLHNSLLLALVATIVLCCLSSNGEAASLAMRRFGQDGPVKRHYGGHIIKYRSQDDPCEPLSETNCGSTEGCVWCKAQAIPSSCFKTEDAARLPPGVFQCDS